MKTQLLERLQSFNNSSQEQAILSLQGVINADKTAYREGPVDYPITRKSVVIVPGMYLRHLGAVDYLLELQVDPEISVQRKIARDVQRGVQRPVELTRRMVVDIEHVSTERRRKEYPLRRGSTATMDDFQKITITSYE